MVSGALRIARTLVSPTAVIASGFPPAACALLAWGGVLDGKEVLGARSVRIWAWAAAVVLLLVVLRWALERRVAAALGGAALLSFAAYATASLAPRLDLSADVGVGEEGFAWRVARAPRDARPPELAVLDVPERSGDPVRLRVAGGEVLAAPGRSVAAAAGLVVSAQSYAAPSFSLRRATGAVEGEGLLKLVPGTRDYFQVALLPHRFYVTLPAAPSGAATVLPDRLHLRIQRGKLKVLEQDVGLREAVRFEGLSLRFDPGARWARIRLRTAPPAWALVTGIAMAVGALGAAWRARRGGA